MMLELKGSIMKEFDIYLTKAPVKVFGDIVNIRGRTFHIQELDKYIQAMGIDDHYKQIILSAYEQNKQDNPNDIAIYRNQFYSYEDEEFYFLATSNQQAIGEFFSRLNQCIGKPKSDFINSVKINDLSYIARNPHLTLEQFDILFKTKRSRVLSNLTRNLGLPKNLAFKLIKMGDRDIIKNVIQNPSMGDDFIIKMLNEFPDESGYALLEISYLPTLSNKVKEAFIKKLERSHNYITRDNFYSPAIQKFFDRSDFNDNDADLILQSNHKQVKEMLAGSQCLTDNTIDKLISLNNSLIYMGLATNPCVTVDKIMTFIDKLDKFDLGIVLRNTPNKKLHHHFINVDDIEIKTALARAENIDAEILERLSDSNEDEVTTVLSNRRFLPIEIVKKLSLKEYNKRKKHLIYDYFNYPELADFWKNHPDNEVREHYAQLLDHKRCKR